MLLFSILLVAFAVVLFTFNPDWHYSDTLIGLVGIEGIAILFGIFPIYAAIKSLFTGTLELGGGERWPFFDHPDEHLSWSDRPILTLIMFLAAIAFGLVFIALGTGVLPAESVASFFDSSSDD